MADFQSRNRGCLGVRRDMGRNGLAREPGGHKSRPVGLWYLDCCLLHCQSEVRSLESVRWLVATTGRQRAVYPQVGPQRSKASCATLLASSGFIRQMPSCWIEKSAPVNVAVSI